MHEVSNKSPMNPLALSHHRHEVLIECLRQRCEPVAASAHFSVYPLEQGDMVVVHDFAPQQIDNNIGYYVAEELLPLLLPPLRAADPDLLSRYSEQALFERWVGAIVCSMDSSEARAWQRFYANTLAALQRAVAQTTAVDLPSATASADFIANFAAIYSYAMDLIDGIGSGPLCASDACGSSPIQSHSILDVATCFGFFPLSLALRQRPREATIIGCDLNEALVALANSYARDQQLAQVEFVQADILDPGIFQQLQRTGMDARFDCVTAIHFLEHLEPEQTKGALQQLWDLTEQRLIIAVPLEPVPDARFGHRQVFDRERLLALGRSTGGYYRYAEHCGGWLVIDRSQA